MQVSIAIIARVVFTFLLVAADVTESCKPFYYGHVTCQRQPPMALRRPGGRVITQVTDPLISNMNVELYSLVAKKSGKYISVQLPSPQCCVAVIGERRQLLLSGDVETNPGTVSSDAVPADFQ